MITSLPCPAWCGTVRLIMDSLALDQAAADLQIPLAKLDRFTPAGSGQILT